MRCVRSVLVGLMLGSVFLASAQVGDPRWLPQNQVVWSTFQNGLISKIEQPMVQVIPSENDFQAYWQRALGRPAATAPKTINWMKEKLVAIHLGKRPSSGYSLTVMGLEKNGMVTKIRAIEHTPLRRQWVSDAPSTPYVIIRVPSDTLRVQLDLKQQAGGGSGGTTIYTPDGAIINPDNYNRANPAVDPRNQVNWGTVTEGTNAKVPDSGLFNLYSYGDWQRYWSQVTGDRQPAPTSNDWNQYRLVAIHLGERPTTGYRVKVLSVEANGQNGIIRAVEEMPVPGSYGTQRKTYPYVVVRVPRNMGNVYLDLTKREGDGTVRFVGKGNGR